MRAVFGAVDYALEVATHWPIPPPASSRSMLDICGSLNAPPTPISQSLFDLNVHTVAVTEGCDCRSSGSADRRTASIVATVNRVSIDFLDVSVFRPEYAGQSMSLRLRDNGNRSREGLHQDFNFSSSTASRNLKLIDCPAYNQPSVKRKPSCSLQRHSHQDVHNRSMCLKRGYSTSPSPRPHDHCT
jgi:hypothetical protein